MPVKNRFAELLPEITEWRRDFHANPEILFETHRTSARVAELLRAFGCDEVVEGIGRTGVVGVIKGKTDTSGKVVGLRADMDALPILEATGVEYASKTPGAMHACGHDGHTAMLLGAAKYLCETRNFDGTTVVIFQPAEEGGGGGREMCEDGMMDRWNIQEVYGMHNWPGHPLGSFAIRKGPFFAATDTFDIFVEGKGGHAAKPQEVVDTTIIASQIVLAMQTIASRNVDPVKQVVVSVTSFETESNAYNVIPQKVHLKGTVRTLSNDVRDLAEQRIKAIAPLTAEALGGVADVNYMRGYPVMVNHDTETEYAAEAAKKISGDCEDAPLVMGGEDFAFMLEERPGAYILVGNGDTAAVHHPAYNFDDNAIPAGCSWWVEMVESRMPAAS
ncbi:MULTISPECIES: M20 aminoacylase family protein [Halocynthiibacter]|uniref:M20 family metallopeptidase n=1 Tax=Halocynthiibacter halioticoli TaxID=2986804 RepID=A0AAE3J1B8_9RHOB|nr:MULTISPECIES: M20 aminoacylase family protein [Halocynthiibacter]MCV6824721.1 M20 family metallopeptidase [Halocynthiibacter halioticoli]MCW4057722.1 M20 family metallopeptidase [Halocynthiibacter sp. SDUM655004]